MRLIRAKLLTSGYKASGEGAHEAEISFLLTLKFQEQEVRFIDKLRYFRNRIKYYGKSMAEEYTRELLIFLDEIYPKLTNS
ncbi:MAG: hypothetical protein AABW92_02975 [Nanoarchaeota archaeon]